jgi:hypothetical protein
MIRYTIFILLMSASALIGFQNFMSTSDVYDPANDKNITIIYKTPNQPLIESTGEPLVFETCAIEDCSDTESI